MEFSADDGRIHQGIFNFIYKVANQPNIARYENAILSEGFYNQSS